MAEILREHFFIAEFCWSSLLYISIAYYMQKGGGWVQIACEIAYLLNSILAKENSAIELYPTFLMVVQRHLENIQ